MSNLQTIFHVEHANSITELTEDPQRGEDSSRAIRLAGLGLNELERMARLYVQVYYATDRDLSRASALLGETTDVEWLTSPECSDIANHVGEQCVYTRSNGRWTVTVGYSRTFEGNGASMELALAHVIVCCQRRVRLRAVLMEAMRVKVEGEVESERETGRVRTDVASSDQSTRRHDLPVVDGNQRIADLEAGLVAVYKHLCAPSTDASAEARTAVLKVLENLSINV